ncbi:MAG TPA: hypothetical protein VLA89_03315 [Gemmatimonadales bacterium]|nr:hypothetical protein [Gemmatimonadales bacterium]
MRRTTRGSGAARGPSRIERLGVSSNHGSLRIVKLPVLGTEDSTLDTAPPPFAAPPEDQLTEELSPEELDQKVGPYGCSADMEATVALVERHGLVF